MDSIMEPYVADLLADDITASMVELLSGDGGAAQMDVGVLDAYLRAIGALPAHPAAPGADLAAAAEVESMASNDDTNGNWDTKVDAKVPSAFLPPPPGFPPLPVPALADEPVYAAPVDEGDAIRAFMQQLEWSEQYNGDDDAPAPDDSMASRPQLCAPYDDDIDANLRAMEKDAAERPSPDYLDTVHSGQISAASRASLVAWMGRLTHRYELAAGTLHRAVSYFDRFLSARALPSYTEHQLSLVGATAVYTAAKYEDQGTVFKLDAREIASYGEFASAQEVLAMEREMMAALGYRLGGPNAETFVEHFTRYSKGKEELRVQRLARHIADRSLESYGCLGYLPSVVAAAVISIARWTLNPPGALPWSSELHGLTGGEAVVVRRPEQKTKGVELSGRRRRARRRVGLNAAPRGSSACTPERLGGADQYPGYGGGGGGGGGIPPRRPQGSARVGPGARAARGAHLGRRIRRSSHVGPIQRTRCARSGRRRKLWVGFTTFCAPPPLACKALAPLTHFCFAITTIFTSHKRSGIAERKEASAMGASPSRPLEQSPSSSEGENHRVKYASYTTQGFRPHMEDALAVELDLDATTSFFGVYDGHGGAEVAMYCAKRFHTMLLEDVDYINNLPNAITSVCFRLDDDLQRSNEWRESLNPCANRNCLTNICANLHHFTEDYVPPSYEGSTACVVIIRGNQIIVGNVGDSRCVLSKNGQAISLSFDHKPHHEAERERIQRAGGHVFLRRILGMLATSRAIGDFAYKQNRNMPPSQQMVTCVPDIRVENITDDTEFLVIASDGVWDGMRNNNVVQFVRQELRPGEENLRETCEKLVGHCLHSNDNATAILVKFKPIEEDPDEVASARDEHQHNPEGGDEKLDINNDNV
uniref:protein-serine/threonine phosphatase n=1 Tax=Oryza glumipatula TaxID=40148 RepID=A0A0D9YUQ5_9ORYZ